MRHRQRVDARPEPAEQRREEGAGQPHRNGDNDGGGQERGGKALQRRLAHDTHTVVYGSASRRATGMALPQLSQMP